ncbi:hypothetical protein Tco_1364258 [Tanacetum coccineum]
MCHLTKLSVKCSTLNANQKDPNKNWGTDIPNSPNSTVFKCRGRTGHALVSGLRLLKTYDGKSFKAHEFWLSVKCRTGHALVSGLRLLKTYDGESFKAHEFCGKVHRVSQIRE